MPHTLLLIGAGVASALPLLLFGAAVNRIPLTRIGLMQYLAPSLTLLIGVLVFHEPMPPGRLAGFVMIWIALAVLTMGGLTSRHGRFRVWRANGIFRGKSEENHTLLLRP